MRLPAAAILTLLAASAQPAAPRSDAVVVLCDRFFDGHSIVSGPARIWIENGRVARIEKGGAPPGQTLRAYDLAGLTVLPGLIDLHAHVAWHFNAAGKLHTEDPRVNPAASLIGRAQAGDPGLEAVAGGTGSAIAKGGMLTKVLAAKRAARSGARTVIASGSEPDVLLRLAAGEAIGTLLSPQTTPLAARKQWLADHLQVAGKLSLDAGAAKALRSGGRSLLPVGVKQVEGEFERGAVVACLSPDGAEIARGLVNYNAQESRRIAGRASSEIEAILGYVDEPELIHRDNLVVL